MKFVYRLVRQNENVDSEGVFALQIWFLTQMLGALPYRNDEDDTVAGMKFNGASGTVVV